MNKAVRPRSTRRLCDEKYVCGVESADAQFSCEQCKSLQCTHCERELHAIRGKEHHDRFLLSTFPKEAICQSKNCVDKNLIDYSCNACNVRLCCKCFDLQHKTVIDKKLHKKIPFEYVEPTKKTPLNVLDVKRKGAYLEQGLQAALTVNEESNTGFRIALIAEKENIANNVKKHPTGISRINQELVKLDLSNSDQSDKFSTPSPVQDCYFSFFEGDMKQTSQEKASNRKSSLQDKCNMKKAAQENLTCRKSSLQDAISDLNDALDWQDDNFAVEDIERAAELICEPINDDAIYDDCESFMLCNINEEIQVCF